MGVLEAPISGKMVLCPKKGREGRGEEGRRGTGGRQGEGGERERESGRKELHLSLFCFLKAGAAHTGPCGHRTGDLGVFSPRL